MTTDRSPYRIEVYREESLGDLLRLEHQLWSPAPEITADHFRWKYIDNPYGSSIHFYLAFHRDQLVGANGMYWSRWESGHPSRTMDLLCRADTVIDPAHRGRGILGEFFRTLRRDLYERGLPYLLGTSASAPVTHTALSDGWQRCDPLLTVRTPRSADEPTRHSLPQRVMRRVRRSGRHRTSEPWGTDPIGGEINGIEITAEPRPSAMADLVARLPYDGRIRHVRDGDYFAWRFRNPLSSFRFLFGASDPVAGYLVLQNHIDPHRRGGTAIVDWEAVDDTTAAGLLDAAVAGYGDRGLFLSANSLSSARREELRSRGFEETRPDTSQFRPAIIVRSTGDELPPERWKLGTRRLGDFDDWDWRDIYSDDY